MGQRIFPSPLRAKVSLEWMPHEEEAGHTIGQGAEGPGQAGGKKCYLQNEMRLEGSGPAGGVKSYLTHRVCLENYFHWRP